jgi:signal transduction histidine kinase
LSLSFIHIEDADAVLKKMNDSRRSGLDFSMTYRIVCKNGLTKQIYMDSKLMYAMEGEATGCYGIIQDVTHTVLLERKLSNERSSRLKNITNAVLTAQENERAEIGKELHDNLNQILGATKLYVDLAKTDDEQRDFCLDKASNYIMTVINHIRAISKKMIIPSERFVGLFGCINMLKYDLSIIHPVDIQFYVDNIEEQDMEEKLQLNIYRIIQEQLNNIVKHSKATHATIDLSRQEDEIILLISDDGMGYDTSKRRQGVGIRNIMSRAELYQGTAEVTSTPGQGYDLKIRLPLYSHINNDGKLSEIATN